MQTPAGLIFDDSRHYLDHLGPFCALRNWPLFAREDSILELARRYYPDLTVIELDSIANALPSQIVACDPRCLIEAAFARLNNRTFFWLPHGNSDKGWKVPIFQALQNETAYVYGQKMIDAMKSQNVRLTTVQVGNFRLKYWKKHQRFYETVLQNEISFPKTKKTYLYAPTWDDGEGNGSFWQMMPLLSKYLPEDCTLIVKIHPNTHFQKAPEIECLIGRIAHRKNIVWVTEFPPIYPLLSLCDVYIGDISSIGYDFLYWKKPMYFLKNSSESRFLEECGTTISPEEIPLIFNNGKHCKKKIQAKVYSYTFASCENE